MDKKELESAIRTTRLKTMAHEAVDTVHEAVLVSIIAGVQRHMKSDYFNFVKEMQEGK